MQWFILLKFWCGILLAMWQRCDLCSRCRPKESCIGWSPEWRHLANTIKLFVLGRDADFCQMTIDTCYRHHCAKRMQRYLFCRGGGAITRFLPPMGVKFGVSSVSHFTPSLLDLNPTPHGSNLKNNLNLELSKQRLYILKLFFCNRTVTLVQ